MLAHTPPPVSRLSSTVLLSEGCNLVLAFAIIPIIFLCSTRQLRTTATNTHSDKNKLTCSLTTSHKLKKEVESERERERKIVG